MLSRQSKDQWYADGLRFTCTQCGNCCTGPPGYVWFDERELGAMAKHVGLSVDAFAERYARRIAGRWSLKENLTSHGHDCVFLDRDPETGKAGCSIYGARPMQCRTWPFWPENLRSTGAYVTAARGCPGMSAGLEGQGTFYPIEKVRILRDKTPS